MKQISDINSKPKYYFKKQLNNLIPDKFKRFGVGFILFALSFGFITGSQNITAAPSQSEYFSYKINGALLAQSPEENALKQSLEKQLKELTKEIDGYKEQIKNISSKKQGVQSEIAILQAQVKKAEAEMNVIRTQINNLSRRVGDTKKAINETERKVEKSRVFLKAAIRYYYQISRKSPIEIVLAEEKLSDYFSNFVYTEKLQNKINEEIINLQKLNTDLGYQKVKLQDQLSETSGLLSITQVKKGELQDLQGQKQIVLKQTQGEENKVKKVLDEKEKIAAGIRAQIYKLAGNVAPIQFGEALRLANIASKVTGIRPAFLLGVLDYESKIGKNVGSCNYKTAMNPNQHPTFLNIVNELGLDPDSVKVSCKPWYGWGGAMGPAQFMPATWMEYKNRVEKLTGNNPPSPWNILDAFMAASIKLTDAGAGKQTTDAEWKSAMIYFAGGNWSKTSLKFYGDDVLAIAARYQKDIDTLKDIE